MLQGAPVAEDGQETKSHPLRPAYSLLLQVTFGVRGKDWPKVTQETSMGDEDSNLALPAQHLHQEKDAAAFKGGSHGLSLWPLFVPKPPSEIKAKICLAYGCIWKHAMLNWC